MLGLKQGVDGQELDYDYIMAPQRGRPYGANLGSMGRNTGTWSIRSDCLSNITSWSRRKGIKNVSDACEMDKQGKARPVADIYLQQGLGAGAASLLVVGPYMLVNLQHMVVSTLHIGCITCCCDMACLVP